MEVRGLAKTYGKSARMALDHVDLAIPRGSIFGLLGPNGAGKSTLINILAGLVLKSGGKASIWGIDIDENPRQARAAIGVVPQELNIDPFFTPWELLDLQAGLYGVPKSERRTDEILEAVGLVEKRNAWGRTLSGGMRRRLMVAKALVHSPPVLVLDEPTAGVDVELRRQLWAHVRSLNQSGTTVLLTTHYLEEAEELCDRIAIINHGKVVACDTTQSLLGRLDVKEMVVLLDQPITEIPASLQEFALSVSQPGRLVFRYEPSRTSPGRLFAALQAAGLEIRDVITEQTDLEDIFLQLIRSGVQP